MSTLDVSMPLAAPGLGGNFSAVPGTREWPSAVGLSLGILCVAVGQLVVLLFQFLRVQLGWFTPVHVQTGAKVRLYDFWEGVRTHLAQPEGFVLLVGYLSGTWMFKLMPETYYSFEGGVNWLQVLQQLLIQDLLQTVMHMLEHWTTKVWPAFYRNTHKPHHVFINPRLFDAFNGSLGDTFFMILVPLYATANLVHCNVWTYMAFGTIFANYLTLIHSEYVNPWDPLFSYLGIGTAGDHHVHHAKFVYNFGHLFTYWDRLFGTYRKPNFVPRNTVAGGESEVSADSAGTKSSGGNAGIEKSD